MTMLWFRAMGVPRGRVPGEGKHVVKAVEGGRGQ